MLFYILALLKNRACGTEKLEAPPELLNPVPPRLFGGHKAVVRPDPIPNSAVKRSIADGSGCIASARVGRRQFFQSNKAAPAFMPGRLFDFEQLTIKLLQLREGPIYTQRRAVRVNRLQN